MRVRAFWEGERLSFDDPPSVVVQPPGWEAEDGMFISVPNWRKKTGVIYLYGRAALDLDRLRGMPLIRAVTDEIEYMIRDVHRSIARYWTKDDWRYDNEHEESIGAVVPPAALTPEPRFTPDPPQVREWWERHLQPFNAGWVSGDGLYWRRSMDNPHRLEAVAYIHATIDYTPSRWAVTRENVARLLMPDARLVVQELVGRHRREG